MKRILSKLNSCYHLIKVAVNPEKSIKSVVLIGEKVSSYKSSRFSANKLFENKELQSMYNERYGLNALNISELESKSDHSLGKRLSEFYKSQELEAYPASSNIRIKRNNYLSERIRKVHDFIHLTMGYDTDMEGEAQVNAFIANQTRLPFSLLIVISIILKTIISNPKRFYPLIDKISNAWQASAKCKSFLTYRWEDKLDQPFASVVQDFQKNEVTQTQLNISINQFNPVFMHKNIKVQHVSIFEINHLRPAILM